MSNDMFLGAPFNIASYALFIHMAAHVTGRLPGELIYTVGDAHIYLNHLEQVKLQLSRDQRPFPTLTIERSVDSIDGFKPSDFKLTGYDPHPVIKAQVAV